MALSQLREDRSKRLSDLIKRSFTLTGHRTSVALEHEFWDKLVRMAHARRQSLSALVAAADAARAPDRALASALRVMALVENDSGVTAADLNNAGPDRA